MLTFGVDPQRSMRSRSLVTFLAVSVASLAPTAPAGADQPNTCFGRRATVIGTTQADVLVGTDRADVIVARGGSDRIFGEEGRDLICGGPGRDRSSGGEETDHLAGGPGADLLIGGNDSDSLLGNAGNDRLRGGRDADFLRPGSGNDAVRGGEGLDVAEYFDSPAGIRANLRLKRVRGWGSDRVHNVSQIEGTKFSDVIIGREVSEALRGFGGSDRLVGGGGRDYLAGDGGDDVLDGGADGDYALYDLSADAVKVDLVEGIAQGAGNDELSQIEHLFGSAHADTFIGDSGENHFIGGDGGRDEIEGRGGDALLVAFADAAFLGGSGHDSVQFLDGPVVADLTTGMASAGGSAFTFGGVESLVATSADDSLVGSASANVLDGGGGSDVILGMDGEDALKGRWGADELDGGLGSDRLDGGARSDRCLNGERTRRCVDAQGLNQSIGASGEMPCLESGAHGGMQASREPATSPRLPGASGNAHKGNGEWRPLEPVDPRGPFAFQCRPLPMSLG